MAKPDKKQEKQRVVAEAIARHLIDNGLKDSGIRTLARVSGISDRMLIYYFGSKEIAIATALEFIAATLGEKLELLIPGKNLSAGKLKEELVIAGRSAEFQPVIRLWFELVGYAVRGEAPYQESVRVMADNWGQWISAKLRASSAAQSETVFAEVEGRLMLELLRG